MKTLSNIRYVLFALMVLGCFANFAQNEYGMVVVYLTTGLFAISWLINLGLLGTNQWKRRPVAIIARSNIALCVISFLLLMFTENDFWVFATLIFIVLLIVVLFVIAIMNRKQMEQPGLTLPAESLGLMALFLGVFFKFLHWPGAGPLLIFGGLILVIVYLVEIIKGFGHEYQKGKTITLFSTIFFLNVILGTAVSVFKNQHWPGVNILYLCETFLLLVLAVPFILNTKFRYGSEKINLLALQKKSRVLLFVFIYMNYWALFFTFQNFGVGPKFYSLKDPAALQKMQERSINGEEPQLVKYRQSYNRFLEKRWESENK